MVLVASGCRGGGGDIGATLPNHETWLPILPYQTVQMMAHGSCYRPLMLAACSLYFVRHVIIMCRIVTKWAYPAAASVLYCIDNNTRCARVTTTLAPIACWGCASKLLVSAPDLWTCVCG